MVALSRVEAEDLLAALEGTARSGPLPILRFEISTGEVVDDIQDLRVVVVLDCDEEELADVDEVRRLRARVQEQFRAILAARHGDGGFSVTTTIRARDVNDDRAE